MGKKKMDLEKRPGTHAKQKGKPSEDFPLI